MKTKRGEYYGDYGITEKGIGTVLPMVMAVSAGANYLVIGRPIKEAKDPLTAVDKIVEDISSV